METPLRNLDSLEEVQSRIEFVRVKLDYPITQFARKLGLNTSSVRNVISKGSNPSYILLQKILEMFPLNSNWLYGGKGEPWTGEDISNYMYDPKQGINRSYKGGVDQEINKRFTD